AGYAFNKAHSASYAMIAYWTAWLKANHPAEYFVAIMDAASGNSERLAQAVHECRRLGIPVLGPDVNRGDISFTITDTQDGPGIRFGLAAVKNVGPAAVQPVVEARATGGQFHSIEDFCKRVDARNLNKRVLESLNKVGAFDELGRRGGLLAAIDRIIALGQQASRLRDSGQTSMFDLFGTEVEAPLPALELPEADDVTERERALWEKELLGIEIAESAVTRELLAEAGDRVVFANQVTAEKAGQEISLLGQVRGIRRLATRRGDPFLSVVIAMLDGEVEAVVWNNVLTETSGLWAEGSMVALKGTIRTRDERVSVAVAEAGAYRLPGHEPAVAAASPAEPLETPPPASARTTTQPDTTNTSTDSGTQLTQANGNGHAASANGHAKASGITVRLVETGRDLEDRYRLEDLVKMLLEFRGEQAVTLEVVTNGRLVRLDMPFVTIRSCSELTDRLTAMLGEGRVRTS
ncbi:MAG: hypothetical protein HY682_12900, partial [Chloroflexi bacterium]|nr:hypothetical protein [Chloroflexota bacterium]